MMKSSMRLFVAVSCAMSMGSAALAQTGVSTQPGTGHTNYELQSIRRQDIGDGYTANSLNQISLQNARAQVGYYGQGSYGQRPTSPSLSASRTPSLASATSKPFSSVSSSPTVSPYLNLFREDLNGSGDLNYQTLVRPQLQQMATNQQFQRQNMELSQRVQSISAQSAFQNPAGSQSVYPTGHQTAFGYYGSYY